MLKAASSDCERACCELLRLLTVPSSTLRAPLPTPPVGQTSTSSTSCGALSNAARTVGSTAVQSGHHDTPCVRSPTKKKAPDRPFSA